MKLLYEDENPNWSVVLLALINSHTDRLKNIIDKHREFILRIPVCRSLLDVKDSLKLLSVNFNAMKFEGWNKWDFEGENGFFSFFLNEKINPDIYNRVKMRIDNFSLLFKFLFESKDVSFEEFDKFLYSDELDGESKYLPIFSEMPLQSFKSDYICKRSMLYVWVFQIYGSSCNKQLTLALKLLSKGDEEHVKRIYNLCLSCNNLKEASQYWEEAKKTELSKYYEIQTDNSEERH
ncbi:UNVERIFIED_CONTAM: hypothetical protein RMT77_016067 [Armadillidium vulgare]